MANTDDGLCPACRKAPVIDGFFGECRDCLAADLRGPIRVLRPDRRWNGRPMTSDHDVAGRDDERDGPGDS